MYGVRRMISTTSSMVKRMPGLVRHRRQMQAGIGAAAGGADHDGGVLQRAAGDDVARAQPALEQRHHRAAALDGPAVAVLVRRRRAGRAGQREADRLADRRHGVGGELAAAGAGRWGRRRIPARAGPRRSSCPAACWPTASNTSTTVTSRPWKRPGRMRAAIHEHAGHVQPQHRHHHAGQRLVAAGEARPARRSNGRARSARRCRRSRRARPARTSCPGGPWRCRR